MEVGCYSLHLYCSNGALSRSFDGPAGDSTCKQEHLREGPAEFTGGGLAEAQREARRVGWVQRRRRQGVRSRREWFCPSCKGPR